LAVTCADRPIVNRYTAKTIIEPMTAKKPATRQ